MPLYDYHCSSCGDFREFRPMRESSAPRGCPVCRAPAERLLSAPFLAGKDNNNGSSQQHNNQTGASWRHQCGFGCSHAH